MILYNQKEREKQTISQSEKKGQDMAEKKFMLNSDGTTGTREEMIKNILQEELDLYFEENGKEVTREELFEIDLANGFYSEVAEEETDECDNHFYIIGYTDGSFDGYVGYDNEPCNSVDYAMQFTTRPEAEKALQTLQKERKSKLEIIEVE